MTLHKLLFVFAVLPAACFGAERTSATAATKQANTSSTASWPAPPGVIIKRDVQYVPGDPDCGLDLYLPDKRSKKSLSPAIIMIHGGGWRGGDKAGKREFITGTEFAKIGYVCASVDYTTTGVMWPKNLLQCKNAVRWLRSNAKEFEVDPKRIGVIGGSAGGHLALMVGYTTDVPELEPGQPYPGVSDRVSAVVDMYGITNLLTRQSTEKDGTPNGKLREAGLFPERRGTAIEKWKLASPVTHITKKSPPTLIIHGVNDTTVDREQSKELDKKLADAGVDHRLIMVPNANHAFYLKDPRIPVDLLPDVRAFFDKQLKHKNSTAD